MKTYMVDSQTYGKLKYTYIGTIDFSKFASGSYFSTWAINFHPKTVFGFCSLISHSDKDLWSPFDVYVPLLKDFPEFGIPTIDVENWQRESESFLKKA